MFTLPIPELVVVVVCSVVSLDWLAERIVDYLTYKRQGRRGLFLDDPDLLDRAGKR